MTQLFVDLDGVFADFDGYYEKLFGVRPNRTVDIPDPPGFWKNIGSVPSFFRDLPVLDGAKELWAGCKELHNSPIILTGGFRNDTERQKREWVAEHIDDSARVICCLSRTKRDHGKPGDVLLDDWVRYRHLWEEMGGVFVLHENVPDSLLKLKELFREPVV